MDDAPRLADALREIANVAAYPAIGHRAHRRRWNPADLDVDLKGRVHVVTGGSAGVGLGVARGLARRGATVIIVCRDTARGERVREDLATAPGRVEIEPCDLARPADVHALADRLLARFDRVDALVNNAGASFWDRRLTAGGDELTFATNVLGGFVLTHRLAPALARAAPARVVHVTSAAIYAQRLDAGALLAPPARYRGAAQYANSKRAQVELSAIFAERLAPLGVTSTSAHPGLTATAGTAAAMPIYHRLFSPLLRDVDQGADTTLWLAASPAARGRTGELFFDREARPAHVVPWTRAPRAEALRLWSACIARGAVDPTSLEPDR